MSLRASAATRNRRSGNRAAHALWGAAVAGRAIILLFTIRHIQYGLIEAGVPMFPTELRQREGFHVTFSVREKLKEFEPKNVPNLDEGIANAEQYAL